MEGQCSSSSTSTSEEPRKPPPLSAGRRAAAGIGGGCGGGRERLYRGVRMRKWGKWVAEIREPNKRSRIWLGSYATAVAAARAYDTAVFYLRGRSARLNFPDEILDDAAAAAEGAAMSAASIRKKATEVGARVDALQARLTSSPAAPPAPPPPPPQQRQRHRRATTAKKNPDLNQAPPASPSPDTSDVD